MKRFNLLIEWLKRFGKGRVAVGFVLAAAGCGVTDSQGEALYGDPVPAWQPPAAERGPAAEPGTKIGPGGLATLDDPWRDPSRGPRPFHDVGPAPLGLDRPTVALVSVLGAEQSPDPLPPLPDPGPQGMPAQAGFAISPVRPTPDSLSVLIRTGTGDRIDVSLHPGDAIDVNGRHFAAGTSAAANLDGMNLDVLFMYQLDGVVGTLSYAGEIELRTSGALVYRAVRGGDTSTFVRSFVMHRRTDDRGWVFQAETDGESGGPIVQLTSFNLRDAD